MAFLAFWEGSQGSYNFAFTPYWHTFEISYGAPNKEWEALEGQNGVRTYDFQKNVWYSVRIDAYGSQIRVHLDGDLVFNVDDTRLNEGRLVLVTGPNTIAQFDNIYVTK